MKLFLHVSIETSQYLRTENTLPGKCDEFKEGAEYQCLVYDSS